MSSLSATTGVVQLTISWSPPSEPNGIITSYQVSYNISGVLDYKHNTSATQHILRDLAPNTAVTFSVRAYTIIGPGEAVTNDASTTNIRMINRKNCIYGIYFSRYINLVCLFAAPIIVTSVNPLNNTSVRVIWTPLNLPLPVVDHYTVHYSAIVNGGSGRRRQTDSGSFIFPASVSSGVVSGLLGGQQYQFSVSVTLSVGGQLYKSMPETVMMDPVLGK